MAFLEEEGEGKEDRGGEREGGREEGGEEEREKEGGRSMQTVDSIVIASNNMIESCNSIVTTT